jgi:hypothetical protein
MGVIHPVLEIFFEAKGLLEARGELGKPTLGLDGVRNIVGVIAIGFLIFFVLGGLGAKPWELMGLDNEAAHRVSSEETTLSEEVSTPCLFPLEANQLHDVWGVLGKCNTPTFSTIISCPYCKNQGEQKLFLKTN